MYFLKYLKFLLSATNHHGVHSPFVYAFVTKCLYKKQTYSKQKGLNSVLKMLAYFNISEINIKGTNTLLEELVSLNFPEIQTNEKATEFVYFEVLDKKVNVFLEDNIEIPNDTVVFINNTFKTNKAWQNLIKNDKITVSIDLFYASVLFFRKEQEKQHFKIRI